LVGTTEANDGADVGSSDGELVLGDCELVGAIEAMTVGVLLGDCNGEDDAVGLQVFNGGSVCCSESSYKVTDSPRPKAPPLWPGMDFNTVEGQRIETWSVCTTDTIAPRIQAERA
jgi:hypothetical protein